MGWVIGIFIYLAIGYIFVLWAEAYEDGFWLQVVCMLVWPILAIAFVICFIYVIDFYHVLLLTYFFMTLLYKIILKKKLRFFLKIS